MELFSGDTSTHHWIRTDEPLSVIRKRIQNMLELHYPESITRQDDHPASDMDLPPNAAFVFRLRTETPGMEASLRTWNRMLKAATGS